jgi:hypothetical protein
LQFKRRALHLSRERALRIHSYPPEETEAKMHAALQLHVAGMIEDGEPIPQSTALAEYMVVA